MSLPICETRPPAVQVRPGHFAFCHRAGEVRVEPAIELTDKQEDLTTPAVLEVTSVNASYGRHGVLHDVSLTLHEGECLAIVGESGSGKTTLARIVMGVFAPDSGAIVLGDQELPVLARHRSKDHRRRLQYVFQNPYASLNPRQTTGQIVAVPVRLFTDLRKDAIRRAVAAALERVSLSANLIDKYPDQLSGGERQRVAIARALVCEPEILVCDEITSALDVSVQAAIVEVLQRLQAEHNFSLLFITHNLALVRSIAHHVAVLEKGRIVDFGSATKILTGDHVSPYTERLRLHTPSIERSQHRTLSAKSSPTQMTGAEPQG